MLKPSVRANTVFQSAQEYVQQACSTTKKTLEGFHTIFNLWNTCVKCHR